MTTTNSEDHDLLISELFAEAHGLRMKYEEFSQYTEAKIADFVHEENHPKIGFIKDVSAGAVAFAAFTFLIVFIITYFPYLVSSK